MVDFMKDSLADIARHVLADGRIDSSEVGLLSKRLMADDKIDEDEAEALFMLNDYVTEQNNCPGYADLFIKSIVDFLLSDKVSPNRLDDYEWVWLRDRIGEDFKLDEIEVRLLATLAERAESVPEDFFNFASKFEEKEYDVPNNSSTFLPTRLMQGLAKKVRKLSGG